MGKDIAMEHYALVGGDFAVIASIVFSAVYLSRRKAPR